MTGPHERKMEQTLERIAATNPAVNAIVSQRPDDEVLAEARLADRSEPTGPLHGVPIAVKDLVPTKGVRTTMGSPIFSDFVPAADGAVARRLKAAGAILIGKTNVPEFGLGSHSTNPIFGVTRTPYDLSRTAGGSSGGAAAALATGMVDLADGSDMMGSLRNPGAFCNVYGLRPTWGMVPADSVGDVYLHSLATEGPMARDPEGLALLLSVLCERDPRRPYGQSCPDLSDLSAPGTGKIGWLGDWDGAYAMEPGIQSLCETAFADLPDTWQVTPVSPPVSREVIWESWIDLRAWATAARIGVHYNDAKDRALLKPAAVWEIERGLSMSAMDAHRASEKRSDWYRAAMGLFEQVDVLALPTAQVWPFPAEWEWPKTINDTQMDTYHRWMEVVVPASLLGLPALNIPAGFSESGLPMGLQLIGKPGDDLMLLKLAQAYHEKSDWPGRRPAPL